MQQMKLDTGNEKLALEADNNLLAALRVSIVRPFRLLATQPIVQVIALYMAYIFGLFYLLIASFPRVWIGQYNQSTSIAGLNYLSLGIGFIIGALFNARISDRILARLTQKNKGVPKPEFRIPMMFVGSAFMPIGLFWYGFSANAKAHWIVPNLGIVVFAAGSVLCIEAMQTYIFDSYRRYAASALAAAIIARSVAGFAVPLASPILYDDLGIGWGTAVLAFIGVGVGIPAPFIFWFFGEKLRKSSQYATG
jgi:MFS family permease